MDRIVLRFGYRILKETGSRAGNLRRRQSAGQVARELIPA
jgi:hypothetical protein